MIWLLIVCSEVYGGSQCLAPVEMPSHAACDRVAKAYQITGNQSTSRNWNPMATRCIAIEKAVR